MKLPENLRVIRDEAAKDEFNQSFEIGNSSYSVGKQEGIISGFNKCYEVMAEEHTELEASLCPEDYGFKEYIESLVRHNKFLSKQLAEKEKELERITNMYDSADKLKKHYCRTRADKIREIAQKDKLLGECREVLEEYSKREGLLGRALAVRTLEKLNQSGGSDE